MCRVCSFPHDLAIAAVLELLLVVDGLQLCVDLSDLEVSFNKVPVPAHIQILPGPPVAASPGYLTVVAPTARLPYPHAIASLGSFSAAEIAPPP